MGRSITPKFVLRLEGGDIGDFMVWHVKSNNLRGPAYGKPSPENIQKLLVDIVNSAKPDGVNAHLSKALGRLPRLPRKAEVINQFSGDVVAQWVHPPFFAF